MHIRNEILIAEDDEKTRSRLTRYLIKEFKVSISTASNRTEALEAIEKSRDNLLLVITDMRMPDVDDGDIVASRAIEEGIPVIITTGTPEDVPREIKGKCLEVLSKPIALIGLTELIGGLSDV